MAYSHCHRWFCYQCQVTIFYSCCCASSLESICGFGLAWGCAQGFTVSSHAKKWCNISSFDHHRIIVSSSPGHHWSVDDIFTLVCLAPSWHYHAQSSLCFHVILSNPMAPALHPSYRCHTPNLRRWDKIVLFNFKPTDDIQQRERGPL